MSDVATVPTEADRIIIESPADSLLLKQLVVADAAAMFALIDFDREHLNQYHQGIATKYPTPESIVDSIEQPDPERPGRLRFGIWDENQMVGSINMSPDDIGYGGAIGYWVGAEHLGHSYAARASSMIVRYAFEDRQLGVIGADVVVGNEASAHSLEKVGFEYIASWNLEMEDGETVPCWFFKHLNPAMNYATLLESDSFGSATRARIQIVGAQRRVAHDSDLTYIVESGDAIFKLEDKLTGLEPGEQLDIPAGTPYMAVGRATMLVMSNGPFSPETQTSAPLVRST